MDFDESANLLATSFLSWYKTVKHREFRLLHRGKRCTTSERIAKGRYAQVYKLLGKAYKVMRIHDRNDLKPALREMIFYNSFKHPHVLSAIKSQMVMEHGRFKRIIHELPLCDSTLETFRCGTFTDAMRIAHQLLQALHYMHSLGVVHGDIKPSNVLLLNGQVRLTDFTLTTFAGRSFEMAYGTLWWRSPECALQIRYGQASDIWAFGVVILDILHRSNYMNTELHVIDNEDLLHKLGRILPDPGDDYELRDYFPRDHNKMTLLKREKAVRMTDAEYTHVVDLLGHCLEWSASKRWTTSQLLQHAVFQGFDVSLPPPDSNVVVWKTRQDKIDIMQAVSVELPGGVDTKVIDEVTYVVRTLIDTLPVQQSTDLAVMLYKYLWSSISIDARINFQAEIYMILDMLNNRIPLAGSVVDFYDSE